MDNDAKLTANLKAGVVTDEMDFMQRCLALCSRIPVGKVMTYGQLAAAAGSPRAARAAGQAMATNPYAPQIPCHRVVAADGNLTGYSGVGGARRKMQMLRDEGVPITDRGTVERSAFMSADEIESRGMPPHR